MEALIIIACVVTGVVISRPIINALYNLDILH